ncbi:A24 family peptidase [Allokutzneria sp. NRRL B-24872]|uniref:prepilin peptidase n=1 Tax=Allokutzneria sp. NRRL B-24872 TaxID=1137961 RepID=UPI000A3A73D8|nr:A24 family peptidase [Allokutzneria sp. NRRL B-24872]
MSVFIAAWAGAGLAVGAAVSVLYRRVLDVGSIGSTTRCFAVLVTGAAFGSLAGRYGTQIELLPYSGLAALGVVLAVVDLIEQRLPQQLTYSCGILVGGLLASVAAMHSRESELLRALIGMALLAGFYLVLALISAGGIGAGDVKFGGVLSLATAWQGWSTLFVSTLLGLVLAALASLLPPLRQHWRRHDGVAVPFGPFQLAGALLALHVTGS